MTNPPEGSTGEEKKVFTSSGGVKADKPPMSNPPQGTEKGE